MKDKEPLTLGPIDKADIDQEAELLKLQGKKPNRTFIRRRYQRFHNALLFWDEVPASAEPMQWEEPVLPDPSTIEKLVNWAIEQGEEITEQILFFLDNPTEEVLKVLMEDLELKPLEARRGPSLTNTIISYLEQPEGCTLDTLYSLARKIHTARRPESAVRQILRRLKEEGLLKEVTVNDQTRYSLS